MKSPWFLKQGKFAGRSVEELVFTLQGFQYLRFLQGNGSHPGLKARLNWVFSRVKKLRAVETCDYCSKRAKYVSIKAGQDGPAFVQLLCKDCLKSRQYSDTMAIEFNLFRENLFSGQTDKKQFFAVMRRICGIRAIKGQKAKARAALNALEEQPPLFSS